MKIFTNSLIAVFFLSITQTHGDDLEIIEAEIGYTPDLSLQAQKEWEKGHEILEKIAAGSLEYEDLTQEEKELIDEFDETKGSIWDVIGGGCSWYCGGGPYKINASSFLPATTRYSYKPENAHDFDFRTAWVEGVKGDGTGEYIEYHFEAFSPRVNKIKIFNGYVKSEKAWNNNSRVRKLKLYISDEPYAILVLQDTRALQTFSIEPQQSTIEGKDLVLKFEILEVYEGEKWDDTAITEIEFDGLDVHCFVKGTMIKMWDGTQKPIDELDINDAVLTYNFQTNKIEASRVFGLKKRKHSNLVKLHFYDFHIISTDDHPYYVKNKGWCSFDPETSNIYENIEDAKKLDIGDEIFYIDSGNNLTCKELLDTEQVNRIEETYAITRLEKNECFFAEGLMVGIEEFNDKQSAENISLK